MKRLLKRMFNDLLMVINILFMLFVMLLCLPIVAGWTIVMIPKRWVRDSIRMAWRGLFGRK